MAIIHNDTLRPLIRSRYTPLTFSRIRRLLDERGTLTFPSLSTGLYSAAITNTASLHTGYKSAWVRDNVYVAHAHWVNGDSDVPVRNITALTEFFMRQRYRFSRIINDPKLARFAHNRPHVRFDGETLSDLPEPWAHDQNDALGYFMWLYCKLACAGEFSSRDAHLDLLSLFVRYFEAIEYWNDPESGHWEEPPRKVAASSIGAVLAGLKGMRAWLEADREVGEEVRGRLSGDILGELILRGESALSSILPWESRGSPGAYSREFDAALLLLFYPLAIVESDGRYGLVERLLGTLQGEYGIRRYVGDSFYCEDYENNMRDEDLTRDYSDDIEQRNAFFTTGNEAQWCVFDPIVSAYYGLLFRRRGTMRDLDRQTEHLNRSLGQISGSNGRYGAFQCPELYYWEGGVLQTSKATPLLWTQANLWIALKVMEDNLRWMDGR